MKEERELPDLEAETLFGEVYTDTTDQDVWSRDVGFREKLDVHLTHVRHD